MSIFITKAAKMSLLGQAQLSLTAPQHFFHSFSMRRAIFSSIAATVAAAAAKAVVVVLVVAVPRVAMKNNNGNLHNK